MNEIFTILEVANLLNITTQAVYKRLQQDKDQLDAHLTTKGGKKSLTKEGVELLSDLMGLDNPFTEEIEHADKEENTSEEESTAFQELLKYLREDNERLANEIQDLKEELQSSRQLREQDRKTAEEERRQHEEARMRADALLMKAMINQEKPRLLDRIFNRNKKKKNNEESVDFNL